MDAVNCGDIITNSTGWFSSPDISGNGEYEFGAECVWVIRVPDNKILHIQFDEIDIEEGLLCSYDWLRVSNMPALLLIIVALQSNSHNSVQKLFHNLLIFFFQIHR